MFCIIPSVPHLRVRCEPAARRAAAPVAARIHGLFVWLADESPQCALRGPRPRWPIRHPLPGDSSGREGHDARAGTSFAPVKPAHTSTRRPFA
eukprot:NODE_23254_length_674_cov_3.329068.p3 GENE.NODE_23254_length_674_cov_3.329068~~NODE_23254_length_674_cov_3.329068.p3  ORF type:complete len:93 (-),score=0.97 NODE_23254_length_674_cov_3.329068:34-312(-)